MREPEVLRAWRPTVPGVREVLHARMTDHVYPAHAHADWALMLVDVGAVAYDLGGRARIADAAAATLLPPGVAHDGRAAPGSTGFRKRVVYLDATWIPTDLSGAIVDRPDHPDLLSATRKVHGALATHGEELAAEVTLVDIAARLISASARRAIPTADVTLASQLRDYLESRITSGASLSEAGHLLGAHPGHLSRSFSAAYGLPPHRYFTSRRVDLARRLLLSGQPAAAVAARAGFYDQAHLTRHFQKVLGITPRAFAISARL